MLSLDPKFKAAVATGTAEVARLLAEAEWTHRIALAGDVRRTRPAALDRCVFRARAMNPLASHWLRMALWLFVAAPVIALMVIFTSDAGFTIAIIFTLYMWALVCVILALLALIGLIVRLLGRGMRALRR